MTRYLSPLFALACLFASPWVAAQSAADQLVSTWMLSSVEKGIGSDAPQRISGRGILILDAAGYVFEYVNTANRDLPESTRLEPQRTFADHGGFWGQYTVDAAAGTLSFDSWEGVSPDVAGIEFTRTFALDGDWLVVTSGAEPQAQGYTRWTWQRVPPVENLSPTYEAAVGFWLHEYEERLDLETGETSNRRMRSRSLIVYTPAGFVGVHFPNLGREKFAGPEPTPEEAAAAHRAYLGYYGALTVYPGEVSHNVLGGISPGPGSILRRYARVEGDELLVTLQSMAPPDPDRTPTATTVLLRRLSGLEDMLPR